MLNPNGQAGNCPWDVKIGIGYVTFRCQLAITSVAVEKLDIHKNGAILGDGKWSVASYKSLVGHLDAM